MDTNQHFQSLSAELTALKNRVRNFIDDAHWQTDGEWKESVLRAVLNRHLPHDVEAVRGFVVTSDRCSQQIDVLLYDKSKPTLFRDGDLVFVTPDAVKGIIEVKSNVESRPELLGFFDKLANDAEFISNTRAGIGSDIFVGLFSYNVGLNRSASQAALGSLKQAAGNKMERVINCVALGPSLFARFWDDAPHERVAPESGQQAYNSWHSYRVDNLAYGYFVSNLLYSVSKSSVTVNQSLYFPQGGKETKIIHSLTLRPNRQ